MRTLAVLSIVVLSACSSSRAPAHAPAPPPAWKDMDLAQREAYMKAVVMPRARALFVAFDPKYADMDCKTCHGEGARDGSFELPSAELEPLPNTEHAFLAWIGRDAEAARYTQFMATKLEPLMGELLQVDVFDPATRTGAFSCGNCHQLVAR